MLLLIARTPLPDAPYWYGRRWLAAVDALAWPALWVLLFSHAPKPVGLLGPFIAALAALFALGRLHRAVWVNHRYWFTTWRWGRVVAAMMLMGCLLKFAMLSWAS
jgi:hypothetical protein